MGNLIVKQGLLGLDCLGLEWGIQSVLAPYALRYIRLCDRECNELKCRVNAKVTLLKGKGLTDFFCHLGMGEYTLTELKPGLFFLEAVGDKRIQPVLPKAIEQVSLADSPRLSAQKKRTGLKSAKNEEVPGSHEYITGKTRSRDNKKRKSTGYVPQNMRTEGKKTPKRKVDILFGNLPLKGALLEGSSQLENDNVKGKRQKTRGRHKSMSNSKNQGQVKDTSGLKNGQVKGHPKKTEYKTNADPKIAVKDLPHKPNNAQSSDVKMINFLTTDGIDSDKQVSPIDLKIKFFPDEDAQVLKKAEATARQVTPLDDLFLRLQALELSLNPDFDTLLSLSAVRGVQPLEYQQRTVRHVLQHLRGRALLCDEVGLGKTVEAGLIMMEYLLRGLVRRVLVLAPPSLVEQWREEMHTKFNLDFVTYDSAEFKAEPDPWGKFPCIIASLDTAKRENHRRQVLGTEYDLVIVDEAHHLKNSRTQAYQLVSRLKKKYILLLTATPVENDLGELFNLITLLLPGQLETSSSFKRKYVTRGNPLKVKNADDLKRLVQEVMVRNRRSETGAIESRRRAQVVEVSLSSAEEAFYRRLTTFVRGHYTPGAGRPTGGVNRFVLKMLQREAGSSLEALIPTLERMSANTDHPDSLRRLLGTLAGQAREISDRSKAEALLRMLGTITDKVVVFTGFRETQRFLVDLLRERNLEVAELHGGMRRLEKEEQVRLFADSARVLVSTETGSEGRNLQFCRNLINYDLPWNPMRIEQRIGRIHRLGQTRDVYIYNLSAGGTIESYILELLDAKINMFQLVVGELDMILGNLKEKQDFGDIVMDIWARSSEETELRQEIDSLGEQLVNAREQYRAVKELDDRLLGELLPDGE